MTDLDTLVRDALDLQASRAPHPDAVRARLDARLRPPGRTVRTTRVLLPVAATVAAAGVVAGISVLGTPAALAPDPSGSPGRSSTPASPSGAPVALPRTVPLRFSPTALPAGLREVGREFGPNGVLRTWRRGQVALDGSDGGPRLDFAVRPAAERSGGGGREVSVAGRPGRLLGGDDKLYLVWRLAAGTDAELEAIGLGLDEKRFLALAASVRPDDGTATFPLGTGARTGEAPVRNLVVDGPQSWRATEVVAGTTVSIGTAPVYQVPGADALPAQQVTVGGRPARFVPVSAGHPYAELVVTLGGNRFLSVAVSTYVAPPPRNGAPTATLSPAQPSGQPPATLESVTRVAERVRWSEPSLA